MEHWSGVMAWEVRRLERIASESQARIEQAFRRAAASKAKEDELGRRMQELENEMHRRGDRTAELEEMVVEMGRRERAIEEEVRDLDEAKSALEKWKAEKEQEIGNVAQDRSAWDTERLAFDEARQNWQTEKKMLLQDREAVVKARAAERSNGQMSGQDRAMVESLRIGLERLLGKKAAIEHGDMVGALEEVRQLLGARENEVVRLKEELREVNGGLEEEIRRVSADRDLWKSKADTAEKTGLAKNAEFVALDKRSRVSLKYLLKYTTDEQSQGDQISDLTLRNESLSTSLQAAQTAMSSQSSPNESTKVLKNRIDSLTAELDSIAGQFNEVWRILPPASRRVEADLIDPRTGQSNPSLVSPSKALNFAALQQLYVPHNEDFSGIDEMLNRVRALVDDGRLMVERCCRLGSERELLKQNAARAKKLAEDSRASLETYQQ